MSSKVTSLNLYGTSFHALYLVVSWVRTLLNFKHLHFSMRSSTPLQSAIVPHSAGQSPQHIKNLFSKLSYLAEDFKGFAVYREGKFMSATRWWFWWYFRISEAMHATLEHRAHWNSMSSSKNLFFLAFCCSSLISCFWISSLWNLSTFSFIRIWFNVVNLAIARYIIAVL